MKTEIDLNKTQGIAIVSLLNNFEKKSFMTSLPDTPDCDSFWYVYNRLLDNNQAMRGITSYYFYKAITEKYADYKFDPELYWVEEFKNRAFDDIRSQLHRNFAIGSSNVQRVEFLKVAFNLIKADRELLQSLIKSCERLILSVYDFIFFLYFACKEERDKDKLLSILLNDESFNRHWDLNNAITHYDNIIFGH